MSLAREPRAMKCFNPRSPRGGATRNAKIANEVKWFQSTLPTRGSDDTRPPRRGVGENVSIHAPHEGERLR